MLNVKALTELLSHNRDNRLCKRWYLMTPNGTLLAYSQPTDVNDLRKQAAIAVTTWQEHERRDPNGHFGVGFREMREDGEERKPLHFLVIESDSSNVLLRRVQEQLLLVLEGGVPPRRPGFCSTVTTESMDGEQQRWPAENSSDASSIRSSASSTLANILKLQRSKLDALAEAIIADFEQAGFHMPDDSSTTIF